MTKRYFAYDPDGGLETFVTEQEAIAFANKVIDDYRDAADDGWDDLVEQVCWGEIKQKAVMDNQKPGPGTAFCYACDYGLADLPAMTHSQAHPACDQCNGTGYVSVPGHAGGRCSCTVVGSPVKSNS